MARVDFEPHMPGIREIFCGDAVQGEIAGIVADIARACNDTAIEHRAANGSRLTFTPFTSFVDVGKYTAIGEVRNITNEGWRLEQKYHLLESFNH